jgi:hypothetical protein
MSQDAFEDVERLTRLLADPDAVVGLRAVAALRRLVEVVERAQVARARASGMSWQQIADQLGVSRQAVHKKYGRG